MKYWRLIFAATAFVFACIVYIWGKTHPAQPITEQPATNRPVLATSFYPLTFLVSQIAGDGYDIHQVTPGGVEPHDFEPSPQDIVQLQKANMLFANGLGLDPWVERLSSTLAERGVTVITVTDGLSEQGVNMQQDNPHVWLDPHAMVVIAKNIAADLAKQFPADSARFTANGDRLAIALTAVDAAYKQGLANCRLRDIIVSHDAFAYLAARFDINVIPIAGFSPQEQPSAKHVSELITLAKQKGIKTVFFETLVSPKLSQTLADEVGATTAVLDPIEGFSAADLTAGKTYITAMNDNLAALRLAMDCQ